MSDTIIKFSLVMCVYEKENPLCLSECVKSIVSQTVIPDEWIIVKDGPLTPELDAVIGSIDFPNEFLVINLPQSVTQGPARAEGVIAAKYDWVAIMDSDDICIPHRFERQIEYISEHRDISMVGGQIAEFDNDPEIIIATRQVPLSHEEIIKFAKKRNPINSMTVMFNRKAAVDAGNYRYFQWFEDYDLWIRMMSKGAVCANLPDVLVKARVGSGMYARRRGISYARSEWKMQREMKSIGFINSFEFIRNAALRIPLRLLPEKAVTGIYKGIARRPILSDSNETPSTMS